MEGGRRVRQSKNKRQKMRKGRERERERDRERETEKHRQHNKLSCLATAVSARSTSPKVELRTRMWDFVFISCYTIL